MPAKHASFGSLTPGHQYLSDYLSTLSARLFYPLHLPRYQSSQHLRQLDDVPIFPSRPNPEYCTNKHITSTVVMPASLSPHDPRMTMEPTKSVVIGAQGPTKSVTIGALNPTKSISIGVLGPTRSIDQLQYIGTDDVKRA
jgi:hypothetical protein